MDGNGLEGLYTTGEYLSRNPGWHQEDSGWKARKVFEIFGRHSGFKEGARLNVLDVACGAGGILAALSDMIGERYEVSLHGLDISGDALALADKNCPEARFVKGDVSGVRDAFGIQMDLTLLMDVIEHFPDPVKALRDLASFSRFIVIHVPVEKTLMSAVFPWFKERTRKKYGHVNFYTRKGFLALLEKAGLDVLEDRLTCYAYDGDAPPESLVVRLVRCVRRAVFSVSPSIAALTLGGCSLLVMAETRKGGG